MIKHQVFIKANSGKLIITRIPDQILIQAENGKVVKIRRRECLIK